MYNANSLGASSPGSRASDVKLLHGIGYVFTGFIGLLCLIPFVMIISGSLSDERQIIANGFRLLPQGFSLEAYRTVFEKPEIIFKAYGVTVCLTLLGTALSLFIVSMTAYVLQRKDFAWRNKFAFFFYFTTLFSGGLVPYYILMIRYLNLKNSYLALLLPLLFNVFNLLIMKNYIGSIPQELTEAARIDGCGDFKIYSGIIVPLSKPALATVALFVALAYWNDWFNSMLFISNSNEHKFTLQYFLYQKVNNIEAYKKIIAQSGGQIGGGTMVDLPTQTLKMALTVVVTGPIMLAYPIVQRYFVQGITIGAVKG